jgi:NAD(P)-dependent dehydrogenase (short-subunit alcohol dehydrogenase family)
MAQSPVVVVLGAGPNVGTKVAQKFTSEGYKVAVVSRSGKEVPSSTAALSISADLTNPESIHDIFEQVRSKLGEPSVVVYNGMSCPIDDFSLSRVPACNLA